MRDVRRPQNCQITRTIRARSTRGERTGKEGSGYIELPTLGWDKFGIVKIKPDPKNTHDGEPPADAAGLDQVGQKLGPSVDRQRETAGIRRLVPDQEVPGLPGRHDALRASERRQQIK